MENMHDNRRQHPRRYYSDPKECFIRKSEDQPWEPAKMLNLSLGGAKLQPTSVMAKGSAFQVKFTLAEEVILSCVTVRVDEPVIGVSFALFDDKVTKLINEEVGNDANAYTQSIID